jgi:hypothetical protein
LLDKGHIVAEGDPDEIADMHEDDAERRLKQKRKAKQLIKHGKVDLVDIRKARKAGTLGAVAEGTAELPDDELDDEDRAELEAVKAKIQARAAARASGDPAAVQTTPTTAKATTATARATPATVKATPTNEAPKDT